MGALVAFPYVALASAASLLFRNVAQATGFAFALLVVLAFARVADRIPWFSEVPAWAWDLIHALLPATYETELWRPLSWSQPAAVFLLFSIGAFALATSFWRFARGDA